MNLRPYQARAIDALRGHVLAGRRKLLLVAPCGSGKTRMASEIISSAVANGHKCLFIAHRRELIAQTAKTLASHGLRVGIIQASDEAEPGAPVQVASIATLVRRAEYPDAMIVFADECHLSASDGWRRVLNGYAESGSVIIGLSASPCRLDGRPLGDFFEVLEIGATYTELLAGGFIVKPRLLWPPPPEPIDLDSVHTRHGDYVVDELGAVMSKPRIVGHVIEEWHRHAEGRRTIVFAVNVAHSRSIVDRFNEFYGCRADKPIAMHIDASTPEEERKATWEKLRDGKIGIVSNVGIATEGFDLPAVKCIVLARPTQSIALYMQMSGRLMRPWNDVEPILIDHGGNIERHGVPFLDRAWSLTDKPKKPTEKNPYHLCPKCFAYVEENPCELCGHEKPVEVREIEIDESVKLEAYTPQTAEEKERQERERRIFFDRQVDKARTLGWKPGAPSAIYKEKYGSWPEWSLSNEVKIAYSKDAEWQRRVAENKARKASREQGEF